MKRMMIPHEPGYVPLLFAPCPAPMATGQARIMAEVGSEIDFPAHPLRAVARSAIFGDSALRRTRHSPGRQAARLTTPSCRSSPCLRSFSISSVIFGRRPSRVRTGNDSARRGIPFSTRIFWPILERHGVAAPASGWAARHLVASDASGAVVGLLPLYVKHHSHGDFIYDWSWAAAYRQLGRPYYPKLMSGLPYTPVAGARLLVAEGPQAARIRQALVEAPRRAGQPLRRFVVACGAGHRDGSGPLREAGAADQPRRPVSLARLPAAVTSTAISPLSLPPSAARCAPNGGGWRRAAC
jgi:hypothetical protein